MKILRTMLALDDTGGQMFSCDTIEHQGSYWLVPQWIESPTERVTRPKRIICLDQLRHQSMAGTGYKFDFVLEYPLPRAVFEGRSRTVKGVDVEVVEDPDIEFPAGGGLH